MIAVCFVTKNHAHAIMSHLFSGTPKFAFFVFNVNGMERERRKISSVIWKRQSDTRCSSLNKFAQRANQNVMKGLRNNQTLFVIG